MALLSYVPPSEPITEKVGRGKVILRDVVPPAVPMSTLESTKLFSSDDAFAGERGDQYARPFLFPFHDEMLAAAKVGAAAVIFVFDVERDAVAGYFDPHSGTHYPLPAVFVGRAEGAELRGAAIKGASAEIEVNAVARPATTRDVFATLAGQRDQRVVVVTHTDGATWVQENGPAAVLALAQYFSGVPRSERPYTIEFVFTSGHLHMSRERSDWYASRLDEEYDAGSVAMVIALEHLGAKELLPSDDGSLRFTGLGELMLWSVGPSETLRREAIAAARRRNLDGVLVAPGLGAPKPGNVPEYGSFGGIGTYYHSRLVPTMALVSGPWSLWAPSFGQSAIDFERMRSQVLAIADVIAAVQEVDLVEIAGDYASQRIARRAGAPGQLDGLPDERLNE